MDKETVKKGIPTYADGIINEMTRSRTQIKFKEAVKAKVDEYFEKTFDNQDKSVINQIIASSGSKDLEDAKARYYNGILQNQHRVNVEAMMMIVLSFLLFVFIYTIKGEIQSGEYMMIVVSLLTLLIAGVTMPMIDMEARIDNMSFQLMGHSMSFQNQVLYFQSKSIIDVFMVMITHPDLQMKAVGMLIVGFSVFFPVIKLLCSLIYFYDWKGARYNSAVQFFVLKSGKWSMADVMVVAIFMAYIGFNGIINSQMSKFASKDQEIMILATNGTSLQPGYYLFLTYTILALFLPGFLARAHSVKAPLPEPVKPGPDVPETAALPIT